MSVDVPSRVAGRLLDLADRFGTVLGDQIRVDHDLTRQELADLVGASREAINKALGASATVAGYRRRRRTSSFAIRKPPLVAPGALRRLESELILLLTGEDRGWPRETPCKSRATDRVTPVI
jgi:hypothetical protein